MKETGRKVIAQNRKARHDYSILDEYEAGVALLGTEVKSLRLGRASLVDSFATVDGGEPISAEVPPLRTGARRFATWAQKRPLQLARSLLACFWSWASAGCAEINQCVGCFSRARPRWLGRAVRNRHRHAIEQASRRWRGGRRDDSARTRRKF